jgi:hypothetical protein
VCAIYDFNFNEKEENLKRKGKIEIKTDYP